VAFEDARERTVMLNFPESMRDFNTGSPRDPDALNLVSFQQKIGEGGGTYSDNGNVLDDDHFELVLDQLKNLGSK